MMHMSRASLRHVTYTDRRPSVAALEPIYSAENEAGARDALDAFDERYGAKHPAFTKLWRSRWSEVVPFVEYPREVRRSISRSVIGKLRASGRSH